MEESGLLAYLGLSHLESAVLASLPSFESHHAVGLSIADVDLVLVLLHRSLEEGSTGQTGLVSGLMIIFPWSPLTLAP